MSLTGLPSRPNGPWKMKERKGYTLGMAFPLCYDPNALYSDKKTKCALSPEAWCQVRTWWGGGTAFVCCLLPRIPASDKRTPFFPLKTSSHHFGQGFWRWVYVPIPLAKVTGSDRSLGPTLSHECHAWDFQWWSLGERGLFIHPFPIGLSQSSWVHSVA